MSTPALALPDGRVLAVDDLTVRFSTSERTVDAVKNLSFHVDHGETLAVVGESGSGKSVTSLALMRLVEHGGGRILGGSMAFRRRNGEVLDLAQARDTTMRGIRGADIAMIFQEPMTSLNPVFTAGDQIAEAIRIHQGKSNAAARAEALRMLELVRIPEARNVLDRFPHQLSGGMRQRVELARALAGGSGTLLMDEPFSSLDYLTRLRMRQELARILEARPRTVVLVTHDIEEAAQLADRVVVLSERPATIRCELSIGTPRPRGVTHPEVVQAASRLLSELGIANDEERISSGASRDKIQKE
jgi:ABC-type dipeptide/oligopeptide/nickel transport system ATPase component